MNRDLPSNSLKISGGLLIAFEGIDGTGKTTMARRTRLALRKRGYNAVYLNEPTNGPHGKKLREIMLSPEMRDPQKEFDLFLLDRRDDVNDNIIPTLEAGGIVCIDRYYVSSMAYQGALGLDPEMIRRENEKFAPVPDLILHFTISVDDALKRISSLRPGGTNQFEKKEYLQRVNDHFEQMTFPQMVKINANNEMETVFASTWDAVLGFVNRQP